jgi:hypothetical protein
MSTRIRFLLILAVAVVLLAGAVLIFFGPNPNITGESCEQIKPGMTQREVESILGCPAGDYRKNKGHRFGITGLPPPPRGQLWFGREGMVVVIFDENGRVTHAGFIVADEPEPTESYLDRLRLWLGQQ